jgi:hypothetical protein
LSATSDSQCIWFFNPHVASPGVPSSDDSEESTWEESDAARALLGFEADEEYVEGSRLVLLSSGEKLALLMVGNR